MFLTILICIFVCYGITNIIVNGTIFEDIKKYLITKSSLLKDSLTFKWEEQGCPSEKYFLNSKKAKNIIKKLEDIKKSIMLETDSQKENSFNALFQIHRESLVLLFNSEENLKRHISFIYNKLYKLSTCMMCSGFWVGLFLVILTSIININLFGMTIILIGNCGVISWCISAFLLSCLFSGTSWFLGVLSTYFGNGETPSAVIHNYDHQDL